MKELKDSRRWHRSMDGDTVDLIYQIDWTEWESGIGIPKIGDGISAYTNWDSSFNYLRCTDIQVAALDNIKATMTVLFSTVNKPERPRAKDVRSWRLYISTSSIEKEVDRFYDTVSEVWRDWGGFYEINSGTVENGDNSETPPLYQRESLTTMRLTGYSYYYHPVIISERAGATINSEPNFHDTLVAIPNLTINVSPNETFGKDEFSWMFESCEATQEGSELWRYDMTFVHAGFEVKNNSRVSRDWNKPNNLPLARTWQYETVSFIEMINLLKGANSDTAGGSR